jgi:hypothetical protein
MMERNLWPRFFFFSAGFAALIAIRGAIGMGETLLGKTGRNLATALLVLLAAASAMTVPGAWHPKQDYIGARDFVQRARSAGDAVVTVDMSRYVYQEYLAPQWLGISSVRELETVERNHTKTWVLYTFPSRLSAIEPDIWSRVERHYKTAAEFPGTVNGGTIVVKVRS